MLKSLPLPSQFIVIPPKHSKKSKARTPDLFRAFAFRQRSTVAQWAKITAQKPGTLYKRRNNGWTDMEVITGKRNDSVLAKSDSPFPLDRRTTWNKLYLKSIDEGHDHSEVQFVQKQSHAKMEWCSMKGTELTAEVDFYNQYDPERDDLPALQAKLQEVSEYYLRMEAIYREATEQLEYDLSKERYKESISDRASDIQKILLNKFEQTNPRPKYTVNTQPFKYSMNLHI